MLAMSEFGHLPKGYRRVEAICNWVNRHVAFRSATSSSTTSAVDTLTERVGVCRDFAHLMIAICRALSIPARFTTGIDYGADPALGPTDFHAYVEVFLDQRWYIFDPSGTAIPMGFVRIGTAPRRGRRFLRHHFRQRQFAATADFDQRPHRIRAALANPAALSTSPVDRYPGRNAARLRNPLKENTAWPRKNYLKCKASSKTCYPMDASASPWKTGTRWSPTPPAR